MGICIFVMFPEQAHSDGFALTDPPEVLEIYTASMRAEIISACSDALSLQNLGADEIVYENITSEKMKQVLGTLAENRVSLETVGQSLESSNPAGFEDAHLESQRHGHVFQFVYEILYIQYII